MFVRLTTVDDDNFRSQATAIGYGKSGSFLSVQVTPAASSSSSSSCASIRPFCGLRGRRGTRHLSAIGQRILRAGDHGEFATCRLPGRAEEGVHGCAGRYLDASVDCIWMDVGPVTGNRGGWMGMPRTDIGRPTSRVPLGNEEDGSHLARLL
ncbi:hypothetical protein IF2G_00548 [Cordyceps javanica]|nr:hypothetical protein IF2G_00548 [Cordyceps javanica]